MTVVKMGVLLFGGSVSLALAMGGFDIGRVAAAFDLPGLAHEELRTPVMLSG